MIILKVMTKQNCKKQFLQLRQQLRYKKLVNKQDEYCDHVKHSDYEFGVGSNLLTVFLLSDGYIILI